MSKTWQSALNLKSAHLKTDHYWRWVDWYLIRGYRDMIYVKEWAKKSLESIMHKNQGLMQFMLSHGQASKVSLKLFSCKAQKHSLDAK